MKMTKKKLFTLAVAVCMIAILSFSTLAWFADDDAVTNKFQMATSTQDKDDIFSVDVIEGVDMNGDGDIWDTNEGDHTAGIGNDAAGETYEDILPGSQLSKRPQAWNTGSYDQYVRMHVVLSDVSVWADILTQYGLSADDLWKKTLDTANWEMLTAPVVDSSADTVTYTYYWNKTLAPDARTDKLFTIVEIPNQLTREDMAKLTDGEFTLEVIAEAVQSENLGDGVDTAYEAFRVVAPATTPDVTP